MDNLGYGLEDPKLALQQDGNVFIAGTQITTDAPAAQASLVGNAKLKSANRGMHAAASLASNTSLLWITMFGAIATAPEFTVFRPTQNQGVERYLNTENTPSGLPESDPRLLWKKDVPSIANRPTHIYLNLFSTFKFDSTVANRLTAEVQLFNASGNIGGARSIDLSSGPVIEGWYPIAFDLNATETNPNTKIRLSIDPTRLVIPKGTSKEKTEIEIDPKWVSRPSMRFRIIPIRYKDPTHGVTPSTPGGIDLAPPTVDNALIQNFKDMLLRAFPVSTMEYAGNANLPETEVIYTVGTPWTVTPTLLRKPIEAPATSDNPWEGWQMVAGDVELVRRGFTNSDDTLYIGLVDENVPQDGTGYTHGSIYNFPIINQGKITNLSYVVRNVCLTDVFCSPVPHEIGHCFDRLHSPTPAVAGQADAAQGPFGGKPGPNQGAFGVYPYTDGRLGVTPPFVTFDVVSYTSYTDIEFDLMGYLRPRWVSDFTFGGIAMMHQLFVQTARPAALLMGLSGLTNGRLIEQSKEVDQQPTAIIELSLLTEDKIAITGIIPGKSGGIILPSKIGNYRFRAFGEGGKYYGLFAESCG